MQEEEEEFLTCFFVFYHSPFKRGNEGAEDGGILEQLIYKYPNNISDRLMEHLLGVLISLYTFTTLSLKKSKLDFLSWSKSKIAIRTIINPTDEGSPIFFVLRTPSTYSDNSISKILDQIKSGIFFALGPENFSNIIELQKYLNSYGGNICSTLLPSPSTDPFDFSFTNVPNEEWHRPSVATVLTEVMLMQTYPELWGIACFTNGQLLASHSNIDLIKKFSFVFSETQRNKVYLTKEDRSSLLEYPESISKIPDLEVIETILLKIQQDSVVFYILADPNISQEVFEKIHETLTRAMPDITGATPTGKKNQLPNNTLVYNRVLDMLRTGQQATEEFQAAAIYGHDLFAREKNLRDVVMHNAKELSVCMNIVNFEHYASVNGGTKMSIEEMYNESLRANPELLTFLQSLHQSH